MPSRVNSGKVRPRFEYVLAIPRVIAAIHRNAGEIDQRPRAFEFREPTWFEPAVYAALERREAAFCISDLHARPTPEVVTNSPSPLPL